MSLDLMDGQQDWDLLSDTSEVTISDTGQLNLALSSLSDTYVNTPTDEKTLDVQPSTNPANDENKSLAQQSEHSANPAIDENKEAEPIGISVNTGI